jgi:hypothetical protein
VGVVGRVIELESIYQLRTVAALKLFFWVSFVSCLAGENFDGIFGTVYAYWGAVSRGSCVMGADWLALGSAG